MAGVTMGAGIDEVGVGDALVARAQTGGLTGEGAAASS